MKLITFLFLLLSTTCMSQKLQLIFGIGSSYSITSDNISYTTSPLYTPIVLIEDPRLPEKNKTNSIDWIQNRNYLGLEPYCEVGYNFGKSFSLGLGFNGRHRQLRYDVYLPLGVDSPVYSHSYKLDFNFIATTIVANFKNVAQGINIGLNFGFNYPLNKLNEYHIYNQVINQFDIRESVNGQVKGGHNGASFTLNPLVRLNVTKYISNIICLGISVEKQIKNDYGSDIRIIDTSTSETILKGSVSGSDLTLCIIVGYKISP
jgi:hypothetical protein